jgi:hypothetical protein
MSTKSNVLPHGGAGISTWVKKGEERARKKKRGYEKKREEVRRSERR